MRFYCHCLNVSIDILEMINDNEMLTQSTPVDLLQISNIVQSWFLCNVPFDQSVHIVWQSLLQAIPVGDMKLYRCLGCNFYTHAANIIPSRVLINKELLNETEVNSLYCDRNYSTVVKIVLPNTANSLSMRHLSSSQDENLQRECEMAQQLCREAIENIERDTEERIRLFQRENEQLLEKETERLNRELNRFLRLMRSVSQRASNSKGSPTLQTSSSYINENSTESGFGSDIFDVNATDTGRHSSTTERALSERNANSDEETSDDPMLDNRVWCTDNGNMSNFATSLPKDIVFHPSTTYAVPQQDDNVSDDLERIGKSFLDLSRSMCTDGTEVFGELPSPRLNTRQT